MKKANTITIVIILAVIIFALLIMLNKPEPVTDKEVVKCIGENSVLYIQLGCPHCEDQKEMFGENKKYLNIVDCFYEREKCSGIGSIPTWVIHGEKYERIQSVEKLKELTGC